MELRQSIPISISIIPKKFTENITDIGLSHAVDKVLLMINIAMSYLFFIAGKLIQKYGGKTMDEKLKKHGAISWSELMTTDVEGAKTFYGQLFGWTFEEAPMENGIYHVVKVNDEEVAGIMDMPEPAKGMPPAWGLYITVDNVDAVAEKAPSLGATVHLPPMDIPEVGRFCVLQDPQGAFISIISYLESAM